MSSLGQYDIASARKMLHYLGRAHAHVQEREHAREKLRIELKKLRHISTDSLKGFIDDLEDSIGNAVEAEKQLLSKQTTNEAALGKIQKSITLIEDKVNALLHAHSLHKQQLGFLETEQEEKDALRHKLRSKLARLEKTHAAAKKSRKFPPAELKRVADRIAQLKQKLA